MGVSKFDGTRGTLEIEGDLQAHGYPILWLQYLPGDEDLMNWNDEALDKPIEGLASPKLFEIKDWYGNPLVYFAERDYIEATKNPPTSLSPRRSGPAFT